jgi:hypothetical protein
MPAEEGARGHGPSFFFHRLFPQTYGWYPNYDGAPARYEDKEWPKPKEKIREIVCNTKT